MRNIIHKVLSAILIAGAIGMITSTVYASVIFVGDTENVGFKSAQKVMPAVDFTCQKGQDWYNGKCVAKCDQTTYPQAVALDETKGTIVSCTDAWGTYYTYTSCHNGWDLIEGNCIETDCTGFSYSSAPESIAGTVTSCKSGLNTFYKYLSCHEGWDFANGKCNIHTCSSTTYPYTTNPSSDAGTIVTCKTGAATQYGYSECRTGWDKSNGYCNIHVCDSNAFPFTSQPSNSIGTVVSCKTGNDVKYGYSACSDDYDLNNGQCESKCALTATAKPDGCATTTDSCVKNGTTYYATTCASCSSGYTLSDGSCSANTCSGYKSTSSSIANCKTTASCVKPTGTVYKCTTCNVGAYLDNGNCTPRDCSAYPLTYSQAKSICKNYQGCESTSGIVYQCTQCNSSKYTLQNGKCTLPVVKYNNTIIGVVFYEDSSVQKIVAINSTSGTWPDNYDVDTLPNLDTSAQAQADMDGQGNTDKIITYSSKIGVTNPMANAARNYAPSVCGTNSFCGKGKWYLPSAGELQQIEDNHEYITVSGSNIGTGWTAASTEMTLGGNVLDRISCTGLRLGYAGTIGRLTPGTTTRKVVPVLQIKK